MLRTGGKPDSSWARAAGLLQGGIDAALVRCSGLLPGQKTHMLLLALGLLTDLRSRGRAARADMRLLPTPPDSPLAAVCTAGTPAIDLQLFRYFLLISYHIGLACTWLQMAPC